MIFRISLIVAVIVAIFSVVMCLMDREPQVLDHDRLTTAIVMSPIIGEVYFFLTYVALNLLYYIGYALYVLLSMIY